MKGTLLFYALFLAFQSLTAQKEGYTWYFGQQAGLDFNTTPPTVLTNGAMSTGEGCASISDPSGNLLFYTDGITVYNKNHAIMANGTGLTGDGSTTQSGIIVKQPGNSNIYYIFTEDDIAGVEGLRYSIVDLSLAAGLGSVTVKNDSLHMPSCEKITAVKHCNGVDAWILSHDYGNADFRAYLLTAAGLNKTPVMSTAGTPVANNIVTTLGQMKVSPDGTRIGAVVYQSGFVEVYDFDASTGTVSNAITLVSTGSFYGCEFSPDGTKFYAGRYTPSLLFQWDLCAGTPSAIVASQTTITPGGSGVLASLQLAPDGSIYIARGTATLSAILNPNAAGVACNYTPTAISVSPKIASLGLPNIINNYFKPVPAPFTYSLTCNVGSFKAPPVLTTTITGCTQVSNPVTGHLWNFSDPSSGAANTSTLANPMHTFSVPGTYTVSIAIQYQCGSDTLKVPVTVSATGPNLAVAGAFTACPQEKRTYTATGAVSYAWSVNNVKTHTLQLTVPNVTTIYTVTGTSADNCVMSKTFTVNVNKCTGVYAAHTQAATIFPNPFSDELHVETHGPCELMLMDALGSVVATLKVPAGKHTWKLPSANSGMYTLLVKTGYGVTHQRFVRR